MTHNYDAWFSRTHIFSLYRITARRKISSWKFTYALFGTNRTYPLHQSILHDRTLSKYFDLWFAAFVRDLISIGCYKIHRIQSTVELPLNHYPSPNSFICTKKYQKYTDVKVTNTVGSKGNYNLKFGNVVLLTELFYKWHNMLSSGNRCECLVCIEDGAYICTAADVYFWTNRKTASVSISDLISPHTHKVNVY